MRNSAGCLLVFLCGLFSNILLLIRRKARTRFPAHALLAIFAVAGWDAARAQGTLQVLHSHVRPQVTEGKVRPAGSMPVDQRLSFSIVLPVRNQPELDQLLARLYDPSSPDYRRFLSVAEFTDRFGPTAADYAAVAAFAQANGLEVSAAPANRLVVPLSGSVDAINKAFHVRMSLYQHPTENRLFFSPDREPSLALGVKVAHLAGLDNFALPKPMLQHALEGEAVANYSGSGPGGLYLGSDMRAAYYGGTQLTGDGQAVGLVEFGGYYLSDVNATISGAGQSYTVPINNVLLDGALAEPQDGYGDGEQVLDIVQAIGMAPGLSQVRVYIGAGQDDANVLNAMASENIAKVLSCSWSWLPEDAATDDVFFKEFAAQGQSFLAASGDSGAFDAAISPYFYPQEDPYVTTVGGTHLTTVSAGGLWSAETAWNTSGAGSGGGVSPDGIAIPSWQAGLANSLNNASTTLRNVPDVAMEADFDNYNCDVGNCAGAWAGTSFAAPRWAGFIALVNQQAVEAGTAPQGGIGFLNPSLYAIGSGSQYATDFHDIVSGNNLTYYQPAWYNAVPGYDLVTGWGSPTGQSLIDDLAGKQLPGFWLSASSPSVVMNPGASGSTTISVVDAGGFSGNVQLAITSTLPAGVTAKWGTNPTSGSSVLTLTAASTTANVTTTVTVTGTSGSITQTTNITLTVHTPSFSLSTLPGSLNLGTGLSATATVAVTPLYGFTGSVTLAVSGLPAGVTATLGTNPTTGSSTLTLNASSTATQGTRTITITGTSGTLTATTTLPLTVHTPTFTLSTSGNVNLGPGTSGSTYVWVFDQFGFAGNVTFSVAGLPNGVTATFNPTLSPYYSFLTLTAGSSTALGSSTITVTGTSGAITATTTFTLNVLAPTFSLLTNGSAVIGQGTTAAVTVFVTPEYGFSGLVNLAVSGLPSGVTGSITPNPTTGYTTLTLTASSSAQLGTSTVTITGTSGTLTKTTSFSLGVYVPTFTLANSGPVNLGQGSSVATGISVLPQYGFAGSVNLTVSGLPSGVTAFISPNPVTGIAKLTLTAASTAAAGTSTLKVTGVSGTQTATTTIPLAVLQPTFTLTGPGTVTLGAGVSVTSTVSVNPKYGFSGSAVLGVSGLPSGVTASFSLNPANASSAMTLTALSIAAPGNYTVTLTGTYGTTIVTTTFPLVIVTPGFTLSSIGSVELGRTTSTTTNVYVQPQNGFTGSVHLAISGLPAGVGASFSPNLAAGMSTLTLIATGSAVPGTSTITITGTSGTQTATTTISLKITTPTFTLSSSPMTIYPGQTAASNISVNSVDGFTGSVKLSISGLPMGIGASFAVNPSNTGTLLNLWALSTVAAGTSNVTVTGTYGAQTVTTTFPLTISVPGFGLSAPASVQVAPGATTTAGINVNAVGGFGSSVNLAVSGLPNGVTASFLPNPTYGSTTMVLTAAKTAAVGTATLTVTGTAGKLTASTTIQLQIQTPSFTLSAPSSVLVAQGGTMTSWVNVVPAFGFNGSVNLAVTGLPAGVTASWSPNPATQSSTLTLTASSTAAFATSTVTITGTSGSLTTSTTLQVAVVPPVFTVYGPGSLTVGPGSRVIGYIAVQWQNGFSGNVNLSVSGLPPGVTASLSPASTSSTSVLTLTASSTASLGQYNAVITGTYGKQVSTALFNIIVASSPFFTLSTPPTVQLGRGTSTTNWVYVYAQNGFKGSVQLAAVHFPSGVTASFSPNPTTGNSLLTLTASSTAALGEYTGTLLGVAGGQTVSIPITISVYAPSFTLSTYQGPIVSPGGSGNGTVFIQPLYGFTGSVNLSVSGLPAGVTASFLPNPTADQSTLVATAASTAIPGQYNVTIKGVWGTQTVTATMPLTISAPTFTMSSGGGMTFAPGQSVAVPVSLYPQNGFNKPVQLTASGLPSGVTASFSPNPVTFLPNLYYSNSTLTFTASTSAIPGEYLVTVTATGGGQTVTGQVAITVAQPSFTLWAPQTEILGQGSSTSQWVYVQPQAGFTGAVTFSVTGLPSGVTASFSPNPATSSSYMTLTATGTAAPGQYYAKLVGTSGTQSATYPFVLTVAPPTFTLGTGTGVQLGQGESATNMIWVYPAFGFSGQVSFTISGLPSGVTGTFSLNPTPTNTTLVLTASSTATPGTYVATVTGTSGTTKVTAPITITVGVPSFYLWGLGTVQLGQGGSAQSYVYVNSTFGTTPSVTLTASGLPSGMTAVFSTNPTTYNSALTLTASATLAPGTYNITVTGTSGTRTSSTILQVIVNVPTFTIYTAGYPTVGQGTSTTTNIFVNGQYGFAGSIQYAISGLPSGVTASFSPNPSSTGTTLTLTASSTAVLGQFNLTVTGTSGKQTSSTLVPLTVYAPTFTISGGGSLNLGRGTSANTYFYVYPQYGFAGSVQFTATGLPSGVTASFSPNPTTNNTILTLTASTTAALGDYKFSVTGTSGTQHATAIVSVGVYLPTFTISGPGSLNIGQGTSTTTSVFVYPAYGFTGNVQFAVSGLPSGVTASFSPNPTTSSSVLTFTASSTAPVGQYTVTVTGTSGTQSASTTIALGVYVPTFTVSVYGGVSIGQGSTTAATVYVNPSYGFTGNVQFAVSGLPGGVTASFSPNPTTSSSTLTLAASSTAAAGQYTLTVTGTSGSQSASTTFTLGVYVPTYTIGVYSPGSIGQGQTTTVGVYLYPEYGFTGSVQLSASGLPSGVTALFSPNPTTGTSTMTLTASSTAAPGQCTITVTGTSGSQSVATTFPLGVYVPTFLISAPYGITLTSGETAPNTVFITDEYGFTGNVQLSVLGLPSGVTASFSPNPATTTSTLTLTAGSSVTAGQYTLMINGASGSQSVSTMIALTIN